MKINPIRILKARSARVILQPKNNEQEFDLYTRKGIMECSENDQISLEEEGFMLGYLSG